MQHPTNDEVQELLTAVQQRLTRPSPTATDPREHAGLALGIVVNAERGLIELRFAQPVAWIGLSSDQVDLLVELLQQARTRLRGAQDGPDPVS